VNQQLSCLCDVILSAVKTFFHHPNKQPRNVSSQLHSRSQHANSLAFVNRESCVDSTLWAKNVPLLLFISSPVIDRFSKFFHWHTPQTVCDNVILIDLTTPRKCVSTLPCEISMKYAYITIITNILVKLAHGVDHNSEFSAAKNN